MTEENRKYIRDNLLVTMGARAAYMECRGTIHLPCGPMGEDCLAWFVAKTVDRYIDENLDIPFDEYIEAALIEEFSLSVTKPVKESED